MDGVEQDLVIECRIRIAEIMVVNEPVGFVGAIVGGGRRKWSSVRSGWWSSRQMFEPVAEWSPLSFRTRVHGIDAVLK